MVGEVKELLLKKCRQLNWLHSIPTNLVGFLCLFGAVSLSANSANLRFEKITVDDGLPYSAVRAINQDELGYLWFGTESGLASFDGYSLKSYSPDNSDPHSIPDGYIADIVIDDKGNLWFSSDRGLSKYNRTTDDFSVYVHDDKIATSLSHNVIKAIQPDKNDILWIATNRGLDRFNTQTNRVTRFSPPFSGQSAGQDSLIRELFILHNGDLLVGGDQGLFFFDRQSHSYIPVKLTNDKQPQILSITQNRKGDIWVGTIGGLYQYDQQTKVSIKIAFDKPVNYVLSTLVDSEGVLWVGTYKFGLYRIDNNGELLNIAPDKSNAMALSDSTALSLFQDHSNRIWVGTYHSGIGVFSPEILKFGSYNNTENSLSCLPSSDIRSTGQLNDSRLLVGTTSGLIQINLNKNRCSLFRAEPANSNSLSNDKIYEIFQDLNGDVWIGTGRGIDNFNLTTEQFESFGKYLNNKPVNGILEINGFLILRTRVGLYKLDLKTRQITELFQFNEYIKHTAVHSFDTDKEGKLWIATDLGVLHFDNQLSHFYHDKFNDKSILETQVKSLVVDQENNIWVTIENEGVFIFNPDSKALDPIGDRLGLKIKHGFAGLYSDQSDNVWLTTLSKGLFKIAPTRKEFSNYQVVDGLISNGFNFDSFAELLDGRLLFGGKSGFNIFDPSEIESNQTPAIVSLTQLKRFGKPVTPHQDYDGFKIEKHVSELKELHLSHRDTVFGLDFVATHYLDPESIQYAYKLQGFDADWITTNAQNRGVTYNNIDPGEYTFRLKAQTKNAVWSNNVALKIIISPAPWLTWWAYTIYTVSFLLAIFIFITKRTQLLQARAIQLQQTVDQRTSELVDEKSKVEQLLSRKNEEFANVSHEFRTPLTLILGPLAQILKTNDNPNDIGRLNIIQRNGYRLLRMVDQLLNMETFRIKSITQRTPQAIGNIIKMLTEAFADLAREKNISLTCQSIENINFEFTPDALEKIVVNLLSNAIKYTRDGGEIMVSSNRTSANELELKVRDNGIGIPSKKLETIFERYHRVLDENSEQVTGAGIGLALVKELVDVHQGRIEVVSELGKGTTFSVYLPVVKEVDDSLVNTHTNNEIIAMELMSLTHQSVTAPQALQVGANEATSNQQTVLVIEDNQDMQDYIVSIIKDEYKVITANDGEQGIKLATIEVPDLIISDVMMPCKDGYQVTHELRNNTVTDHIPIILLTARGDRESRLKGWYEKADEYLTKPFDAEELIIRIGNLLSIRDILRQRFNQLVLSAVEVDNATKIQSLHRNTKISAEDHKQQVFLANLDKVVAELYTNPELKVAVISSEIAMSERQLYRKLTGILDISPTQYLRNYRLIRAAELLAKDQPVSNVALDVGFASHTYFGKCFKAKYGIIPSEYRQKRTRQHDGIHRGV